MENEKCKIFGAGADWRNWGANFASPDRKIRRALFKIGPRLCHFAFFNLH